MPSLARFAAKGRLMLSLCPLWGGGLTSLQTDETKFASLTCPEDWPEEPKHSNGPSVKNESLASEENCNMFTGNEDLSVK